MPYIEKSKRKFWMEVGLSELFLSYICKNTPSGELNYIITKILLKALGKIPNYARYNEIIGVLECCKLELYRREISEYEDSKKDLNGDVY